MHRLLNPYLLAALSGVLHVLIFPSAHLYYLSWIALVPLLFAVLEPYRPADVEIIAPEGGVRKPRIRRAFLLAWIAGTIWGGGCCYWIFNVMSQFGGIAAPVAVGIVVLFAMAWGVLHGVFASLIAWTANRHGLARALMLVPFLWVFIERMRDYEGFNWNHLGTTQVDNIPLAMLARITGVYGISFVIALVNASFTAALLARGMRRRTALFASLAAAVSLQAGILAEPAAAPHDRKAILVQHNTPILERGGWDYPRYTRHIVDLSHLSARALRESGSQRPGLIVWPETPAPFYTADPFLRAQLTALARGTESYVITGSIGVESMHGRRRGDGEESPVFNSATLIAPSGEWGARYDKNHLVPFGEYIPFKKLLFFAESLTREVSNFTPGAKRMPLEIDGGLKLGVFICYESVYPSEIREFAANGAQVFVNVSNDGWFGDSSAPWQHLNMARMRAMENRRWLLRATNNGITSVIDPLGRVVASAPRHERVTLEAPYQLIQQQTFYSRHGDVFVWACAIIAFLLLVSRLNVRIGVIRG